MSNIRYPIGIQSFSKLREEGFIYVDKSRFIANLVQGGQYYFLSRPRRFGKSLFISMLQEFFEGRRELFKGLDIDKMEIDWTPSPVLHFDLNTGMYDEENGLLERLHSSLCHYELKYGLQPGQRERVEIPLRFEQLIRTVYETTGKKVVILVDEYDKPLLGIEENVRLFEKNQALLKAFFSNLKSMDSYIRMGFITGVARFNRVSVFSDLNNLNDISLSKNFAEICGWTEEELIAYFKPGIEELAIAGGEDFKTTLGELKNYYDGYKFVGEAVNPLYNPFSVLMAIWNQKIRPYWFETGTPTFLVRRIKKSGIDPSSLNMQTCRERELEEVGLTSGNPIPLMFQTGYLTIDSFDPLRKRYNLRFPNQEVEYAFSDMLLPLFVPQSVSTDSPFNLGNFQDDLIDGKPEMYMERLSTLLKNRIRPKKADLP